MYPSVISGELTFVDILIELEKGGLRPIDTKEREIEKGKGKKKERGND